MTLMAFGALSLLSPHSKKAFLVQCPLLAFCPSRWCPLGFPAAHCLPHLCGQGYLSHRGEVGEGGKQSSETEVVVAWKGCSKAPRRDLCAPFWPMLYSHRQAVMEKVPVWRHKLLCAELFLCIITSRAEWCLDVMYL